MKRKIMSLILPLAMIAGMVTVPASAQEGYKYTKTNDSVTITGYEGTESELSIPSEIEGLPVTEIADKAFENNAQITSVTIPEGVTKIGYMAFYHCENLESVVIPSSIKSWVNVPKVNIASYESNIFSECEKLSSVTFSEGLEIIGQKMFENCVSLKKVVIPSSVKNISYAFHNCTGLEEVAFEDNSQLSEFGSKAFSDCSNLKVLEIPAGVTISIASNGSLDGLISMKTVYLYGNNSAPAVYSLGANVNYYCIPDSDTYTTILNYTHRQSRIFDINEEVSKALGELKEAADSAGKLNRERYTEESYSQLEEALEKAKKRNESSYISGIRASAAEIISAMENLEEKPEIPTSSSNKPTSASAPAKTSVTTTAAAVKAPAVAKVKNVKAKSQKKKTVKVTWKKQKGVKGYSVQISNKKNFKKTLVNKTLNKNSKKIAINSKKLKSGKKYFVRVRAYKTYTDANGKVQKAWGSWSAKKSVKVK